MNRAGFSLVELSIVLVILGLLVGGVLGGQSLIKAAQLRSVTSDLDKFQTALNTFQGKYNALPGDMSNAIDYWGAAHATPATCVGTASTGLPTCNGNGDGSIATLGAGATYFECFRTWQHLSNAGLIEGNYSGVAGGNSPSHSIPGTNVPKSRISGGAYFLINWGSGASGIQFPGNYKHALEFGGQHASYNPISPIVTTEDAYNIDSKIDDGRPGTGSVSTQVNSSAYAPGCATTDSSATAAYALSSSGNLCSLYFKLGY